MIKILSITLVFVILFSNSAFASSSNEILSYDGILFETEELIADYNELTPAQKDVLKENGDIVVVSIEEKTSSISGSYFGDVSTCDVMPTNLISGRIVVTRNSDATRFFLTFYVTWTRAPEPFYKDKMAICWAGGSALISSSFKTYYGGGYYTSDIGVLSEIKNNELVAYEVKDYSYSYCIVATVSKSTQPGLKNISGGYAHKTFGLSGISVGIDSSDIISFSASFGTKFDTMSPVYTTSYLR